MLIFESLTRLSDRVKLAQMQSGSESSTILTFDKDDEDTLDFVTACANLRSINFGIEARSKFDVKRMWRLLPVWSYLLTHST